MVSEMGKFGGTDTRPSRCYGASAVDKDYISSIPEDTDQLKDQKCTEEEICVCVVLGITPRALHLVNEHTTIELHPLPKNFTLKGTT
jgi:hypothetical protein